MRPSIFLYLHRLTAIRRTVAASLSVRDSHAAEAVAAGFGFRTHAAALSRLRSALPGLVWGDDRHVMDADLFADRIVQLAGPIDRGLARTVFLYACGQEALRIRGFGPDDHPDAAIMHVSRTTMVARARFARLPFLLERGWRADRVASVDLRVRAGMDGFIVEDGVVYFDPRRLPGGISRDSVVEMLRPLYLGLVPCEVASTREIERLLVRCGVRTDPIDFLATVLALRDTDRHLTDAVATRILTRLSASSGHLDAHERREVAVAMLELATERLSTLGRYAVDEIARGVMGGFELPFEGRPIHPEDALAEGSRPGNHVRSDDDPLVTIVDFDGRRGLKDIVADRRVPVGPMRGKAAEHLGEFLQGTMPEQDGSPFIVVLDEDAYHTVDGMALMTERVPVAPRSSRPVAGRRPPVASVSRRTRSRWRAGR